MRHPPTLLVPGFRGRTLGLCRFSLMNSTRGPSMFTRTPIDQIGFANRPHGRLRLFLLLPLAQPHPRPSAVLIDELDAGRFESTADC
jgi:hypothetical protein